MPLFEYVCVENGTRLEVIHGSAERIETWGQLCRLAQLDPGDTPETTPVRKLISAPSLAFPKTNTELKNMGFTKLVKREKGVYENVTATSDESRFVKSGDKSSMPKLQKKITD